MKILNAAHLKQADEATIKRQGITSYELMERAGNEVYNWLLAKYPPHETAFYIYCGTGNNGGDGLVIARLLTQKQCAVYVKITGAARQSDDFKTALQNAQDADVKFITDEPEHAGRHAVIIDALFGTGLNREPEGEALEEIVYINNSGCEIVSIDVPSGLFLDKKTEIAVQSDYVLAFQMPKLAFYLPQTQKFIKHIAILEIGLDTAFIENTDVSYFYTDMQEAVQRYRPVPQYAHKGTQGHALIIGGSYGKAGAALLCTKAALKAGCGLVTAYIPKCGYTVLQTAFPEAMVITGGKNYIDQISFEIKPDVIAIGPGLGQEVQTQQAVYDFLKINRVPLIIDADALNILSYNKDWLELLPENSVLTPHPKELQRLVGEWHDDFDKIEKIKAFSKKYNVILVAKDASTLVCYKDEVHVNSSGNAALATGGSGDVLTGIITGLAAQGYDMVSATIFGVYLHGHTADIGSNETGKQAFTASSIINYLGKAFMDIEQSG